METKMKNYVFLITYVAIIVYALTNLTKITDLVGRVFYVLMPFIYGFIIAYIINAPYEFFRNKLSNILIKNNILNNTTQKLVKFSSIFLSYSMLFAFFSFIILAIIPQLVLNLNQLIDNFYKYSDSFFDISKQLGDNFKFNFPYSYSESIIKGITNFSENFVGKLFPSVFNFTKTFAISVYNWIIGIIISLYLIGSKEKLLKQLKVLLYTCIPNKFTIKIIKISNLVHANFGKFIVGKCIDSLIIGVLCFLGAYILKIPYALLISVIIGITNIIPFFGPFIGAIPCIMMLLFISHIKAFWFAVFILILQQIDGNIIGPKILGNTVGISGFWIMFSVIVGGGLFGVPGMILGVPVFAVLYTIISDYIRSRQLG